MRIWGVREGIVIEIKGWGVRCVDYIDMSWKSLSHKKRDLSHIDTIRREVGGN